MTGHLPVLLITQFLQRVYVNQLVKVSFYNYHAHYKNYFATPK